MPVAGVDEQDVRVDVDLRIAVRQLARIHQCVVARRPSSSPVCARRKAPERTLWPPTPVVDGAQRIEPRIRRGVQGQVGTMTVSGLGQVLERPGGAGSSRRRSRESGCRGRPRP